MVGDGHAMSIPTQILEVRTLGLQRVVWNKPPSLFGTAALTKRRRSLAEQEALGFPGNEGDLHGRRA
jgi:hypothetical protein